MRREIWTIKSPLSGEVLATFIVEADPVRDEPKGTPPYIPPDEPHGPGTSASGSSRTLSTD